jgi:hypothetical protein
VIPDNKRVEHNTNDKAANEQNCIKVVVKYIPDVLVPVEMHVILCPD